MIVGVAMDVFAIMVECLLAVIVTIQVSLSDVHFWHATQPQEVMFCPGVRWLLNENDYHLKNLNKTTKSRPIGCDSGLALKHDTYLKCNEGIFLILSSNASRKKLWWRNIVTVRGIFCPEHHKLDQNSLWFKPLWDK